MDRNESSPSPRQFSQHPTMSLVYLDPSSAPVLWWLGLLRYVTLLLCYHPCSLIDSTRSLFKLSAYFRHLYSQISEWYLWLVLEGPQVADKWKCQVFASIYNMQERFPTSVDSISACSGSFVLVTFSQLNENPPQRLMPPEAIQEAQIHLLSSLSNIPAILQSRQDGNKESRTQIAVRSSFTGRRACSLLIRYPIVLRPCWDVSFPSILFLPRSFTLQEDGNLSLSSPACSLIFPTHCGLPTPVPYGPLHSLVGFSSTAALCISSSAPKGYEFLWRDNASRSP